MPEGKARSLAPRMASSDASTSSRRRLPVIYSREFNKHRPPPGHRHPECPERLDVCVSAIRSDEALSGLIDWVDPVGVDDEHDANKRRVLDAVHGVHSEGYVEHVRSICARGGGGLDNDTYLSPDTYDISLLSVSAWLTGIDMVLGKSSPQPHDSHANMQAAWVLSRPPGHHSTPAQGMGFCIFSNAAIAAKYALSTFPDRVRRVCVLDFDVHHGNGTEAAVKNDERIRFASSHQFPLYPGSGAEGVSGSHDNVLNLNLEAGADISVYRKRFEDEMLPFLVGDGDAKPDLFIVSAGFDAMDVDPLAQLNFKAGDYKLFTQLILDRIGDDVPVVFGLEGGYNLDSHGLSSGVVQSMSGYCFYERDQKRPTD